MIGLLIVALLLAAFVMTFKLSKKYGDWRPVASTLLLCLAVKMIQIEAHGKPLRDNWANNWMKNGQMYETVACFEEGNPLFSFVLLREVGSEKIRFYKLGIKCPPKTFVKVNAGRLKFLAEPTDSTK